MSRAAEDALVAKRLFLAGCFGLPWLWIASAMHNWSAAKQPGAHPDLVRYTRWSAAGGAVMTVATLLWIMIFQLSWRSWGTSATGIMLVIPDEDYNGGW